MLRRTPSGRGSAIGILSAFYDLFVGISSFTAGWVAHRFNYSAAFLYGRGGSTAAAIAGKFVFVEARPAWPARLRMEAALDEAEEDLVS